MVVYIKERFSKPALSIERLIAFLEQKGLTIHDRAYAEHCLRYIGYYRLKIYMRSFQTDKYFNDEATFEKIVDVYNFDRELRLLCLDPIERIEVALRSHLINVMGAHGGPHFYNDDSYFLDDRKIDAQEEIKKIASIDKNSLPIKHYRNKYYHPSDPAFWCITESSTFGGISKIYSSLKSEYQKEISKEFKLGDSICKSWFKCLSTLRNICAHHGRLWNTRLVVNKPKKARDYVEYLDNEKCYSRFSILKIMLDNIDQNGGYGWAPQLINLVEKRPKSIKLDAMGFPEDWLDSKLWK